MRILIVTDLYWPHVSGVSRATSQLASRMQQRGHSVALLTSRTGPDDRAFVPEGVEVFRVPSVRIRLVGQHIRFGVPTPRAMSRIVEDFNPDIVHIQTPMTIGHAIARATKRHTARLVVTNLSLSEITFKNLGGKRGLPRYLHWIVRACTISLDRKADVVVVPSTSAIHALYSHKPFRGKDLLAISNGVDTDHFAPRQAQTNHDSSEHTANPTILFVGRVDQDKDIGTLIQAVSLIAPEHGVKLRIVGDGKYMNEAQRLVEDMGLSEQVVFTGWMGQEGLLKEYQSATVFCLPSMYETQSIATLEAMAAGLPVVVSDGGAVKELCAEGLNGYVCTGGSAESFARALGTICASPQLATEMGQKSRSLALTHSVAVPIAKHEALYRSLLRTEYVRYPRLQITTRVRELLGQRG